MSTEIPSEDETVLELTQFHLSLELRSAIQSLSTQMKCSPEETLEMSLREHFFYTQTSEMDEGILGSGWGGFRRRMK